MIIQLGVFGKAYANLAETHGFLTFTQFYEIDKVKIDIDTSIEEFIIHVVTVALNKCTHCNFLLDHIRLPLTNTMCYSPRELMLVLKNPEYLNKTTFWCDGEIVDKQKVLHTISDLKNTGLLSVLLNS